MRAVWISGLTALALLAGFFWYLAPLDPGALALQFAFTPRAFGQIIHFWSPDDLARYRIHLAVDVALLLAYGLFGYLYATRAGVFAARAPAFRHVLAWLLPVAACLDALENVLHWWLTEVPRFGVAPLYALSGGASSLKWLLILGFGLLSVYALYRADD
ncbi:hypothetical protein GPA27_24690 [Aromatoleum toluolicum]|uniref:Transmembrane protein n=1 Tax=Aromatoleum toluolicum TaxID=90060 RepID=A0ABX1NMJ2_9RHOO|nr:hypothetical protein [Aromatoleum toluolicum]NMG00583.1 hypothetical protein [Aromatoleum toluolicum]